MKFALQCCLSIILLFSLSAKGFARESIISLNAYQEQLLTNTEVLTFNPLPAFDYATTQSKTQKKVHPAIRFFIIGIGAFPLVYLITYPIVIASTSSWNLNKQITTSLAITGGISITVSLIDFFLGFRTKPTNSYERI